MLEADSPKSHLTKPRVSIACCRPTHKNHSGPAGTVTVSGPAGTVAPIGPAGTVALSGSAGTVAPSGPAGTVVPIGG